jgi:hypothetical protein
MLDIMLRPVFYLKHDVSETGFPEINKNTAGII